jgi:hypothetical protein
MKLTPVFALLLLLVSGATLAQDNAGLYFYGPPPSVDDIVKVAGEASVSSTVVESVTRVTVAWPDVTVVIHIDTDWRRVEQLSSIRDALAELPRREQHKPAVREFLANLDRTTACWGSLIEPGYDREGRVAAFFTRLIGITGGFLSVYQSFYSADGRRITGMEDDPEMLR